MHSSRPRRVVIVGGGFTGAAVAYHLAHRLSAEDSEIVVVEPRAGLGEGLAYSTREPAHRINVPAARMSLLPDEPEHFQRWLEASGELARDPEAIWPRTGAAFPQRSVFGRYVASQLDPFRQSGRVRHRRTVAEGAERTRDGWRIALGDGSSIDADLLVLAATHPPVATPPALAPIANEPGYIAEPYDAAALEGVRAQARVLIVGAGLTAADIVATLDRKGHRGPILALSRNGLRSRGHAAEPGEPRGDFHTDPSRDVPSLVRSVRAEIRAGAAEGRSWHDVLDAVREQGGAIWAALPVAERRRLVRRLRTFWDVHRFRIAPQVEAVLDRRARQGRFANIAARLLSSAPKGEALEVIFHRRGASRAESALFDLVVNTTGPSHRDVLASGPLLSGLAEAGHLRGDAVGLGIATSEKGRAVDGQGRVEPSLFIAGPLARGTFGELMGLPEVSRYARFIAEEAALQIQSLASSRDEMLRERLAGAS